MPGTTSTRSFGALCSEPRSGDQRTGPRRTRRSARWRRVTTPWPCDRTWGDGPRKALLLHGSTSSSVTWWKVGPALAAAGWTVTAPDLPGHGQKVRPGTPVLPAMAAGAVADACAGQRFDLLLGHSFGAAVALELLRQWPGVAGRVILEELPGASCVDWDAEADAVTASAAAARRRPAAQLDATRSAHPRWADDDCRHAVADLARCCEQDVATGLRRGATWTRSETLAAPAVPVLLLLAPDTTGVNHLQDATALRGADRDHVARALAVQVRVMPTGHCVHRDDPAGWLTALTEFCATTLPGRREHGSVPGPRPQA